MLLYIILLYTIIYYILYIIHKLLLYYIIHYYYPILSYTILFSSSYSPLLSPPQYSHPKLSSDLYSSPPNPLILSLPSHLPPPHLIYLPSLPSVLGILVGTYIYLLILFQLSRQFDPACFIGVDG